MTCNHVGIIGAILASFILFIGKGKGMHMTKIFTSILLLFLWASSFALETKDCSDYFVSELEAAYEQTADQGARLLEEMNRVIDTREELSYRDRSKVKRARLILNCALKRLPKLYIKCESNPDDNLALFRTLPYLGNEVVFNTDTRYLTNSLLAASLIHEATHKCGTTDADYFLQRNKKPDSTLFADWPEIASSYEYWIFRGFCVPSVDCKKAR